MRRIDWAVDFFCSGKFGPTKKTRIMYGFVLWLFGCQISSCFFSFVVLGALGDVKTPSTWRFPPPWKHLILSYISVETLADVCVCVCFLELYDVTRPIGFLLNHLTMTCRDTRWFKPWPGDRWLTFHLPGNSGWPFWDGDLQIGDQKVAPWITW